MTITIRLSFLALLGILSASAFAQDAGNSWNPVQAQNQNEQPPRFIGDGQSTTPPLAPQLRPPQEPGRFAPADLEQRLDSSPLFRASTATQPISDQPQTLALNQQQPSFEAGTNIPPTSYASPPQGYGFNGYPQGYGGYPQQGFGGYPLGYGGFAQQGYGGYPQEGYGGYPPQGYSAYPQAYGGYPRQGYGYGGSGYPGYGYYGPSNQFQFPGNFGSFPGSFSNGGMPGFGFSPFGFF